MSSVVRKSKGFVPKVKKSNTKRRTSATMTSSAPQDKQQEHMGLITPNATQVMPKRSSRGSRGSMSKPSLFEKLSPADVAESAIVDDSEDEHVTTQRSRRGSRATSFLGEPFLSQQQTRSRRPSVAQGSSRRLSGINPGHVRGSLSEHDRKSGFLLKTKNARRRSSVASASASRRGSFAAPRPRVVTVDEEGAVPKVTAVNPVQESISVVQSPSAVKITPNAIKKPLLESTPAQTCGQTSSSVEEPTGEFVLALAGGKLRKHRVIAGPIQVKKPVKRKRKQKINNDEADLLALSGVAVAGRTRYSKRLAKKAQPSYEDMEVEVEREFEEYQLKQAKKRKGVESAVRKQVDAELVYTGNEVRTISSISQLPRKIHQEDTDLWAQVTLDESSLTLADLCKPLFPVGKVSEDFEKVNAAIEKKKADQETRRRQRKEARERRVPLSQVIDEEEKKHIEDSPESSSAGQNTASVEKKAFWDRDLETTRGQGPQLKMVDGKMVVDEDSTRVQRSTTDFSTMEREVSNPYENPVISTSYSKRSYSERWTNDEKVAFYNALSTYGTDFTMIAQLFPYRTRKQVKAKFNLEERRSPEFVELALRRKLPLDFDQFCRESGQNIMTMEYYERQLAAVQEEHDSHMNLIEAERQRALREDAENSRKREFESRTGSKQMSRKEKVEEFRKNETVIGEVPKRPPQPITDQ
ncbi:hypothetical protein DICA4_D07360 [Diutina catenulata]